MTALTTRDTLDALTRIRAYVEGLDAFYAGDEPFVREDVIDTVDGSPQSSALLLSDLRAIASGAVVDAATLAEDEALVEAIAADQKEAADSWGEPLPGAERKRRAAGRAAA